MGDDARPIDAPAWALERLREDGLIRDDDGRPRTTPRWQAAMARAARRLMEAGEEGDDLRVPVAWALVDLYGAETPDDELVDLVETMASIEAVELDPSAHLES